jgi:death-on-curing protein
VAHVERICYSYAKSELAHDEPIPPFSTRFPGVLEQVLAGPRRHYHHGDFTRQAAILFYEMIKQHPFLNGNKRVATVTLITFLSFNDRQIQTDWRRLYRTAVGVAESNTRDRDAILDVLVAWLKGTVVFKEDRSAA